MDKESFMAWKAVLFDMDGVLIDSEEYMAKTGVRALKKYGINAKESDFAEFVGCGENRYVGGVAEKYGVPYPHRDEGLSLYLLW